MVKFNVFVAKEFLCGLSISSSWPVGTEAAGRWVAALVARSTRSETGQKERPRENIARFSFICALLGLIFLYTDLPLLSIIYFKVKMRRKFKSNTFGIFSFCQLKYYWHIGSFWITKVFNADVYNVNRISKCGNVDKIWQRTSHLKRNVYLNFFKGSFVSSERKCGSRCVRLDTQYFTYFLVQAFYQKCTRVHRHTDTVVSLRQYWGNILIEKVSDSSIFCKL